jgi:hypothetical protein
MVKISRWIPPTPGSCALERLDGAWVIMAFDLEHYTKAITHIHQPGIFFTGGHQHPATTCGAGSSAI